MNIYYLSDNMARLTPTTGSIRHVLSNRTYKEVRCPVDAIHMYTDGLPSSQTWEASSSSATVSWA